MLAMLMLLCAACAGGNGGNTESVDSNREDKASKVAIYPVFSLYENTGRDGYQIYKNDSRLASINVPESRKVVAMRAYKTDCYVLLSRYGADSASMISAEIYKNGRPAMQFEPSFDAIDMDIEGGHFYVLGTDTQHNSVVVYRDGIRVLDMPCPARQKPCRLSSYSQDVFVAIQGPDSVSIMKNGETQLASFKGTCTEFKVSHMGYYTIADSMLYSDMERIMYNEYYRWADRELFAIPQFLSLTDRDCYVGCQSYLGSKYFACIFKNKGALTTILPDSKHIGDSDLQTYCAGVAACEGGNYSAYYRMDADGNSLMPVVYRYYFESEEKFSIDFGENKARLLFMATSR